jgi:hypothetical protein
LRLVSDFASWQRATDPAFRTAARTLASSAHASLFESGPSFLADPFCGGGSIPLEGLRLGATSYASDLNPVATLISKVTLEYVQRFGDQLFAEVELVKFLSSCSAATVVQPPSQSVPDRAAGVRRRDQPQQDHERDAEDEHGRVGEPRRAGVTSCRAATSGTRRCRRSDRSSA